MKKFVELIQRQTDILLKNVEDQINGADLEVVFDGLNNSRYLFHMLHSMEKYFMNPYDYKYDLEQALGIKEDYSVIDDKREGYIKDDELIISREKLQQYFEVVSGKINAYVESLTDEELLEKPVDCPHTKFELILGQYRHIMFHLGLSECLTVQTKGVWLPYTGFKYIKSK
ncbi:MAG: hypothetical protein MJ185_06430 [Treponema sp.]|nr:hypothetical protein [Treponema sp.]